MILCVGATPAIQRVLTFDKLQVGSVNRAKTCLEGIAGKSVNVAKVVRSLGAQAVAVGFHGGDYGEKLILALADLGIGADFIRVPVATRVCTTVIDLSAGTQTELVQESGTIPVEFYETLFERTESHLDSCEALVLSGTITPGGPTDFYARCARIARARGVPCCIDAKGDLLTQALPEQPSLVKPNVSELSATVGHDLQSDRDIIEAARNLCARGAERVVVTAGAAPALAVDRQTAWRIYSPGIQALNPIGSGDSFTAGLVLGLTMGKPFPEACRQGAAAGAANALTWMAGEVDPTTCAGLLAEVKVEPVSF